MEKNRGFTLVELIAVIVILGILAVSAIPQFLDLRTDARNASAAGVGGALAAASATNYARGISQGGATAIDNCRSANLAGLIGGTLATGTLTVGGSTFTISAGAIANAANGTCTITHGGGGAAQTFIVVGCGNATCS